MTKRKAQRTAGSQDTVLTATRLTPEQHERFKAIAAREHRNVSQELRRLIELRLAADEDIGQAA